MLRRVNNMRRVIAASKPLITCKQCTKHDVYLPHLESLLKVLYDEGYIWADIHHDEYNVYKVKCENETGIGVSAAEGEYVCTDLRHKNADGFWLDDKNVKFITQTDKELIKASKRRARELNIKLSNKH